MSKCPCCGSALRAADDIAISLDTNKLAVAWRDESVSLRPTQAVFMHSVVNADPGSVSRDTVIRNIWGAIECDWPNKAVDVHLHTLRKRIAPLGLGIETVRGRPPAYRLVRPS